MTTPIETPIETTPATPAPPAPGSRLPIPPAGSELRHGEQVCIVRELPGGRTGFEYRGVTYPTLGAAATVAHADAGGGGKVSGWAYWGLKAKAERAPRAAGGSAGERLSAAQRIEDAVARMEDVLARFEALADRLEERGETANERALVEAPPAPVAAEPAPVEAEPTTPAGRSRKRTRSKASA